MNYLALCKRVHLLGRFGADRPGTAPTTVTSQSGVLAEIVTWVNEAYRDLQTARANWLFRSKTGTLVMEVGTSDYTPSASGISDYKSLLMSEAEQGTPYVGVWLDSRADESRCFFIPYEQWKLGHYDRGITAASPGRPAYFTENPDFTLSFYPKPDQAYNVTIPYQRTLHSLAADNDEPIIPEDHHMVIVWKVLRDYYCTTREQTREYKQNTNDQYRSAWYALTRDQLPEFTTIS